LRDAGAQRRREDHPRNSKYKQRGLSHETRRTKRARYKTSGQREACEGAGQRQHEASTLADPEDRAGAAAAKEQSPLDGAIVLAGAVAQPEATGYVGLTSRDPYAN
jgi:hypothetical protein